MADQQTRDETRLTWLLAALAATLTGWLARHVEQRFITSFDFAIYRRIAGYFTATGHLPAKDEMVGQIAGSYADFTPINLRIYQAMSTGRDPRQWFIAYTLMVLSVGIAVLAANRRRLGLSMRSYALTLGAVCVCAIPVFYGIVDKAAFLTATVIAAVCVLRPSWRSGAALGVMFGWTGLGALALPMCVLRGTRRERITAAATCTAVSAVMWSSAGSAVRLLLENRIDRENRAPFWFSVWHLLGDWYSPTLRTVVFAGVSGWLLYRYWRNRIDGPATVVALVFLNLLVSNNTDATRIAIVLPLGVLLFGSDRARVLWCSSVVAWACVVAYNTTGHSGWLAAADGTFGRVVFVNVLLIAGVVAATARHDSVAPYWEDTQEINADQLPWAVMSPE